MKNKNNIDELFKSKLEDRNFDIKPAFLNQLNGQLDAREKSKWKRVIYFSAGVLLLLSVVYVVIIVVSNNERTNSNQTNSISEDLNKSKAQDNQNYNENSDCGVIVDSGGGSVNIRSVEVGSMNFGSYPIAIGSSEEAGEAISGESGSGSVEETGEVISSESGSGLAEETGEASSGELESGLVEQTSEVSSGESKSGLGEETVEANFGKSEVGSSKEAIEASSSESVSDTKTIVSSEGSGVENLDGNKKLAEERGETKPKPSKTVDNLMSPEYSQWSLQFSMGGNYISKNGIAGNPESIAIRKDQESNVFTPQVNLAVNYDLNKLRLSTGLSFAQHGENLNYLPVIYDSTFVSSFTFAVDSATMDTTYLYTYDTTSVMSNTAMQGNKNNRHSYITVPINFGYTFTIVKNRFTITPKGGIGIRFLIGGNGRYITDDLKGIREEKDKPVTMSYNGSIEFAYHFGNKSVFLAPTYHSTVSTFKSLHKYGAIGAKFGIVLKL